jgi:hypothetical protein
LHFPYQHRAHYFVGNDIQERAGGKGMRGAKLGEERRRGGGREEA